MQEPLSFDKQVLQHQLPILLLVEIKNTRGTKNVSLTRSHRKVLFVRQGSTLQMYYRYRTDVPRQCLRHMYPWGCRVSLRNLPSISLPVNRPYLLFYKTGPFHYTETVEVPEEDSKKRSTNNWNKLTWLSRVEVQFNFIELRAVRPTPCHSPWQVDFSTN